MVNEKLLITAAKLLKAMDRSVDSCTPQDIADIIKFHSKGAAAAGVASGWVPGAGGVAATAISAGFIWTMYARINSRIGFSFSKNILKSLASGIATNLAGYLVGSIVLNAAFSFVPGLGSIAASAIAGGVSYALTLASGIVYLKILTNIFNANADPTRFDIDQLKEMAKEAAADINMKEIYEEAKQEVKRNKEQNVSADYNDYEMDDEDEYDDESRGYGRYDDDDESRGYGRYDDDESEGYGRYDDDDEEELDYVEIARDITEAMTIAEIRELLERHGFDSGGNKKNLIGWLARALEDGDIELNG